MVRVRPIFFLFVISVFAFSADWPVKDITNKNFSSFFGESRGDHFHNGVDIVKKDGKVYPTEKGEVLFYYDEEENTNSTFGLGKYLILEHYEYRSYYSHLYSIEVKNKVLVDKTNVLGIIGNTGRSSGPHLHFAINKDGVFIDPFDIVKEQIGGGEFDPVIESLLFKSGYYMNLENGKESSLTLPFREYYDIYVYARTFDDSGRIRGIKSVEIDISDSNGNRALHNLISFNYIDNGRLNSKYTVDNIYFSLWNRNYIYLGRWEKKVRREKYTVKISVKDPWNNKKEVRKEVNFK